MSSTHPTSGRTHSHRQAHAHTAAALGLALLLAACGAKESTAPAAGGGGPPKMPPAEVGVVTVQTQSVALQNELPGRVSAVRVAQVRARVNGVVLKRLFREGSDVKAGPGAVPDRRAPLPGGARQRPGRAGQGPGQPGAGRARIAERYKPLVEANAISQQEYSNAWRPSKQAEADVAGAKAALQTARDQPRLRHRHGADRRAHRPVAGHRRRAGQRRARPPSWR